MKERKVVSKKLPIKKIKKQVTLTSLTKKCQVEFNAFIRRRDKGLPCISCSEMKENIQAGHFFAVRGFAGLRFDERNVSGECASCNGFNHSHLIFYYDNLKIKLGDEVFEQLKADAKIEKANPHKFTRRELEHILQHYKKLNNDHKDILL